MSKSMIRSVEGCPLIARHVLEEVFCYFISFNPFLTRELEQCSQTSFVFAYLPYPLYLKKMFTLHSMMKKIPSAAVVVVVVVVGVVKT